MFKSNKDTHNTLSYDEIMGEYEGWGIRDNIDDIASYVIQGRTNNLCSLALAAAIWDQAIPSFTFYKC